MASDCAGLCHLISTAVGAKVMLTVNLDVADGLVNGVCRHIVGIKSTSGSTDVILLKFDNERVGQKAASQSQYRHEHPGAVPIYRHYMDYFL